jgi:hypothetical protein
MSVYFITNRKLNICKIGHAADPKKRLMTLQCASAVTLSLEATLPGSAELERKLHKRFAADRLSGEWFTITEELERTIQEAAASPRLELVVNKPRPSREPTEQAVEKSLALHRRLLAEGMADLAKLGPIKDCPVNYSRRFYQPVPVSGGQFNNRFAIRGDGGHRHRLLCADLNLSWDQADRLCDVLEQVREYALQEGVEA